jgi:hypothetical protein
MRILYHNPQTNHTLFVEDYGNATFAELSTELNEKIRQDNVMHEDFNPREGGEHNELNLPPIIETIPDDLTFDQARDLLPSLLLQAKLCSKSNDPMLSSVSSQVYVLGILFRDLYKRLFDDED